jgi:hypothetical protein
VGKLRIRVAAGDRLFQEVLLAAITPLVSVLPVPPGKYTIEVGDQMVPLELVEGQQMEINLQ